MTPYRTTARVVGVLFIVGTAAGVLSGIYQGPGIGDDALVQAAAHADQIATGALFEVVMGLALAGVAIAIYPVLRLESERLAIAYIAARVAEATLYVVDVILLLALLSASRSFTEAAPADAAAFQAAGELMRGAREWTSAAVTPPLVFGPSALILNFVLYRARLVPRWLAAWGFVGAVPFIAAGALVLYGLEPFGSVQNLLDAPLALQEMVFALWLIVRGFETTGFAKAPERVAALV